MEAECHVNVLRQDKSIGAFVLCNVRLHLEPREGGGGGSGEWGDDETVIYQNKDYKYTTTFSVGLYNVTEETVGLCYQASGTLNIA